MGPKEGEVSNLMSTMSGRSETATLKRIDDGIDRHNELVDAEDSSADFAYHEIRRKLATAAVAKGLGNAAQNAQSLIQAA